MLAKYQNPMLKKRLKALVGKERSQGLFPQGTLVRDVLVGCPIPRVGTNWNNCLLIWIQYGPELGKIRE